MRKLFIFLAVCLSMPFAMAQGGDTTMEGDYIWTRSPDESGSVRVVFSNPSGGSYDVAFYFKFRGEDHVYSGKAKGNLENGALKGEVQNESKNRTFNFEGATKEGAFSGTHSESRKGKVIDTGTIQFKKG